MDENTVEGIVTEGVGKAKDATGALTGDLGLQADGKVDQLTGKAQRKFGDTIEEAQDQIEGATELVRANPFAAIGIAAAIGFLLGLLIIPGRKD